jgi:DNA-binding beta-propeller fold protein YncE
VSGGTLLGLRAGHTAVASDPDRDAIYVVDTQQATLAFTVTLNPGDEPGRLVEDGTGRVHVALRSAGALATIDPSTGAPLFERQVCPAPRGVAWDPSTDLVWVACATGELVGLPAAGGDATIRWVVQRDLRDVVVTDSGLAVTRTSRSS